MAAAMVVAGGVAYAATVVCDGAADRDPDPGQCQGTNEADEIVGTEDPEVIRMLAGNDLVFGHGGNDEIYGDKGNDVVDAMGGNDTIYGGPDGDGSSQGGGQFAVDNLEGGGDSDTVYGNGGSDWIDAAANDTAGSVDISIGGRGNDHIDAGDGNVDIINCGRGKDVAFIDVGVDTDIKGCEEKIGVL